MYMSHTHKKNNTKFTYWHVQGTAWWLHSPTNEYNIQLTIVNIRNHCSFLRIKFFTMKTSFFLKKHFAKFCSKRTPWIALNSGQFSSMLLVHNIPSKGGTINNPYQVGDSKMENPTKNKTKGNKTKFHKTSRK